MQHGMVHKAVVSDRRFSAVPQFAVSLALHAAVLALLLHGVGHKVAAPQERSIAVQIVNAAQYAAALAVPQLTAPRPEPVIAQPVPAALAPPVPQSAPSTEEAGMVRATHLQAATVLAEPGSKAVRETLPLLASDERMTQLCDIEALEQIHLWKSALHPDVLVAYAMAETQVSEHVIQADGGAFRNERQWYRIKFRCAVADDFQSVTDFQFSVGALIPPSDWDAHNLTTEEIE